jgi:tagatose 1,6-diphosphate aldolase GatY/KbaY
VLVSSSFLLSRAREGGYAVGGFNVYTLEGAVAVIAAAENLQSPAVLQLLPAALKIGGVPLVALCLGAARSAAVPVSVHLDHCSSEQGLLDAMDAGIPSLMADGSGLAYADNLAFTRRIVALSQARGCPVEAELGRLSGSEDGVSVAAREACLTDPEQAADFVEQTGVDALAVCVGNVHGTYHQPPALDFPRLAALGKRVGVPLVLHGASGLPEKMIREAIARGVCKFNVNTELRQGALGAAAGYFAAHSRPELVELMSATIDAIQSIVAAKMRLFGSTGRACAPGEPPTDLPSDPSERSTSWK